MAFTARGSVSKESENSRSLSDDELLAWASTRVREHYRQEDGKCHLFGDITGYRFVQAPGVSVRFDIEGRHVETIRKEFVQPWSGRLGVANKMVEVQRDGTWKIDVANKEPK